MIFFILCNSLSLKAEDKNPYKSLHLVQACNILDISGKIIKTFPGDMCIFLEDGSFISANNKTLKFFTKDNQVKWELPGHFHHQLNLTKDGNRILVLSSEVNEVLGKKVRTDKFLILSLEGKFLSSETTDLILAQTKIKGLDWVVQPWLKDATGADVEATHCNSFYEIPKIPLNKTNPIFKEGHFIINCLMHGIFILSSDLKVTLLQFTLDASLFHQVHDVQINERGNLLLFNNMSSKSTRENTFSTILEIDSLNKSVVFVYPSKPKSMFYSKSCGGVQELDNDNILYSDQTNGTFIYSKKKKTIVATIKGTHHNNGQHFSVQQVKAYNLTKFVEARKN